MNELWYLYVIKSSVTDGIYIGKTNNIKRRWSEHKSDARSGVKFRLYKAMRKHGIENFYMTALETHETNELVKEAEIKTIKKFRESGIKVYNTTDGGEGAMVISIRKKQKSKCLLFIKVENYLMNIN